MQQSVENQPATQELQTSKLHEAIISAHHVTVEFGTGDMPLFEIQDAHTFNTQNLYIGVNIDSKQHKFLADKIKEFDGFAVLSEKNKDGNIDKLPIPDESVDTVFIANVFGEPDSQHIMEPFKNSDGLYKGNTDINSKIETLSEAKRLLKEGGRIVILENNTPYKAGFSGNYNSMVELLENSGFQIADAVNQKDADWAELVVHFAKPAEWWSYSSYLVIAQKTEQ
jgi:ubiquinone/menaquinone biosynthesis C-methylase UbiE